VGRVDDPALVGFEPTGVLSQPLAEGVSSELVGGQPGAPAPGWHEPTGDTQLDPAVAGIADARRCDHRKAVGADPAQQHVSERTRPPGGAAVADARPGALGRPPLGGRLFELAIAVKAAQRELERRMNEAVQHLGLTAAQADAISVIGLAEPVSLKDLGELLIAEAGHPSRLVDRLVDAGFVDRSVADGDRRRVELSLTAEGRRMRTRIEKARGDVLELGRQLVGERDIEPVLALLRELLEVSPYSGLIERRAELLEQADRGRPDRSRG
jgi:MarR family transcriptional regulator, organic hydroperoxide resistance regulator